MTGVKQLTLTSNDGQYVTTFVSPQVTVEDCRQSFLKASGDMLPPSITIVDLLSVS